MVGRRRGRKLSGRTSGWRIWLLPYFGSVFFLAHVVYALRRGGDALKDPGVGWHLTAGRMMLASHAILRTDPFSFTVAGRPWIDYYWLYQIVFAGLERIGGLPLVATVSMLLYAAIPVLLYRNAVRAGASPLAALPVVALGYTVLLSHAFTRPHVVTYLGFAVLMGCIDDVQAGRRDLRALWWLPAMAVLWANGHGGFVAGLGALALAGGVTAVRALVTGDRPAAHAARVLVVITTATALATLLNPYGWNLHREVLAHVSATFVARFPDFQPPGFGHGGASVRAFEALVLLLVGLGAAGCLRVRCGTIAVLVAMLHLALSAARNMNLFAVVVTPVVATGVTSIMEAWAPDVSARWHAIAAEQERLRGWPLHLAAVGTLCVALALAGRLPFPTTLLGLQLSRGAAAFIDTHTAGYARAFNTDALGGVLIHRFWPRLRVFVDDRGPVYGDAFMSEYFTVLDGAPGWQAVLDRWNVSTAIVSTSTAAAAALRASSAWRVDYGDEQTTLFTRVWAASP